MRQFRSRSVYACLWLATIANADPGPSASIHYRRFNLPPTGAVHLVTFHPARYTLRVIDNGPRPNLPRYGSLADAMQRNAALAGINGGFFDEAQFTPVGWMVAGGHTVSPFDPKSWQEGLIVVKRNSISLLHRDAITDRTGVTEALQSGPWLVRAGRAEESQKQDERRARRVFVAAAKDGTYAIGFATPVTFYELAQCLLSPPVAESTALSDVLALDGASSAGFWCNFDGQQVSDPESVTVRNFLAVVPAGAGPAPRRSARHYFFVGFLLVLFTGSVVALRTVLHRRAR